LEVLIMARSIVVVGSVNLDLVASVDRIPAPGETLTGKTFQTFFGGKGGNQAVCVAQLGYPVSIVANVGDDEIGESLRNGLRSAGVSTSAVTIANRTSSGVALIVTDRHGQNSIVVVPGANGKLLPADILRQQSLLESAGAILLQLEIPLETVTCAVEIAHKKKIPVILDPAPARELSRKLLAKVTWLTPNESEAWALCGGTSEATPDAATVKGFAEDLLARGPKYVVVKVGSRGAYLAASHGERQYIPAYQVRATDCTAAGDAFNGGLAVGLMKSPKIIGALQFASAVAALSVTRAGAQPSMPSKTEVSRFIKKGHLGESNEFLENTLHTMRADD
jgi:ribokinase